MTVIAAINIGASGPRIDLVTNNKRDYTFDRSKRINVSKPVVEERGFINVLKGHLGSAEYDLISIGAAGPVKNGSQGAVCDMSNMKCHLDQAEIASELGKPTFLCNDMPPMVAGAVLDQLSIFTINKRLIERAGTRIAIAPGTGLGYGYSLSNGKIELIGPSEGGHAPYASSNFEETTEIEERLFAYMRDKFPENKLITQEMVLSGSGVVHILGFLRDVTRHKTDFRVTDSTPKLILELLKTNDIPDWLDNKLSGLDIHDRAIVISTAAEKEFSIHCMVAQAIWKRLLGLYLGHKLQDQMPTRGAFLGGTPINKLGLRLVDKAHNREMQPFTFLDGLHTRENENYRKLVDEYPIYGQWDDSGFVYGLARLALSHFGHISDDIPVEVV